MVTKCFHLAGPVLRISLPIIIEILPFGLHQELGLGNGCLFHLVTPHQLGTKHSRMWKVLDNLSHKGQCIHAFIPQHIGISHMK